MKQNSDSRLRISYGPLKFPHVGIGSHAMYLQCLPIKLMACRVLHDMWGIPVMLCYARAHITLTTFTRLDQTWSTGCLLALYGSTMHPARLWRFQDNFFSAFCVVHLKKKRKLIGLLRSIKDCPCLINTG